MSLTQAVLLIDHQNARLFRLGAEPTLGARLHAHSHNTRQHGSNVRTEHEFFAEVCDALAGFKEVLVAAAHLAQTDFKHYVEKHRPHLVPLIVGWETVDHPSDGQLVALARKFFARHDQMAGQPVPPGETSPRI